MQLEKDVGDFQPKLLTRKGSEAEGAKGSRRRSSGRTNALYEHGKAKGQERRDSFSPYAEVSNPAELTFAPKIKTKKDRNGGGAQRIDRLYQAGVEKEFKKLQKDDEEKESQRLSTNADSYDARMGFDRTNTGLGQDLVTTGARTNALYKEAQMREFKKKQRRKESETNPTGATFKPKLVRACVRSCVEMK